MSNLTSTAKTVHAVKPGYRMRSLCGTMQNTASKHPTNAPVDCPECLAAEAEEPTYGEMVGHDLAGHTRRYQTRNGQTFNEHAAPCVEYCNACNGTGGYADESWYDDGMM